MFDRLVDGGGYGGGVIGALDAAVDAVDDDLTADELVALLRARDRLDERLTTAVGAFDARGGFAADGAVSCAAWLRWRGGLTHTDAARLVRTARTLRAMPVVRAAWAARRLTAAQVQAITHHAGAHLGLFAHHETAVVGAVEALSAADTASAMRHWAARAEAIAATGAAAEAAAVGDAVPAGAGQGQAPAEPGPAAGERPGTLGLAQLPDGTWHLAGTATAEQGSVIDAAIRLFGTDDPTTPAPRRRMDGLTAACAFALAHRDTPKPPRHRPHLSLHLTLDDDGPRVAVTDDGTIFDAPATAMALCDCTTQRVVWGPDGHLLDYGRTTRVVPNGLRRAVMTRDRHCRFPGCDRPASWADVHHVTPWLDGGHTSLQNTVLICRHHHTTVHLPGWHTKLHPDATFEVTTPTGTTHTSRPPPRR